MLHIILYNNNSSGEVLNKNLTQIAVKEVSQYTAMAIESPVLILSGESINVLDNVNYVYIEEFARFYNAVPIALSDGNYQLNCEVDVLMSHKSKLLELEVIVDKNQYESNMYLDDGSFITESRENIQIINYSGGFNDYGTHILIAAGG